MDECCDWHAICLNDKELYKDKYVYLSYCFECNSISYSENGVVTKLDSKEAEYFREKYKETIKKLR